MKLPYSTAADQVFYHHSNRNLRFTYSGFFCQQSGPPVQNASHTSDYVCCQPSTGCTLQVIIDLTIETNRLWTSCCPLVELYEESDPRMNGKSPNWSINFQKKVENVSTCIIMLVKENMCRTCQKCCAAR